MRNLKSKIKNYSKGFSLIEMIIAIGLFGVASTIITGTVLSMIVVQDKAIAIRSAMDNLGFAMEIVSKDIRTGYDYQYSGSSCGVAKSGTAFDFMSAYDSDNINGPDRVYYRVVNGRFEKSIDGGYYLPLTASDVNVYSICFFVDGTDLNDDRQPIVTIILGATAGKKSNTEINLQTTISQRRIDY